MNPLVTLYETLRRLCLTERIQHEQGYPTRIIRVLIYITECKLIALRNAAPVSDFTD
jgi:hypothetical protein